jgi:hypothetical protein
LLCRGSDLAVDAEELLKVFGKAHSPKKVAEQPTVAAEEEAVYAVEIAK